MRFKDKVAVVAGGGGGIGRGVAVALGGEGAQVVIWDTYEMGARQAEEQIKIVHSGQALAVKVDILHYDEVKEAVNQVLERFGQIDIMVVTPGGGVFKPLKDMPPEFWQWEIDYNVKTVFNCFHAVVEPMIKRNYGKLLCFLSTTGGTPSLAGYGAGKAALLSLTQSLAAELAPHKINVNCMTPGGAVLTPLTVGALAAVPGGDKMLEGMIKMALPREPVTPEDVARTTLFLVSDEAERLTGQALR